MVRALRVPDETDMLDFVFIHINKTAGSSVEKALGIRFEHKTASEKIEELGRRRWEKKYSFTIVRNPWDKVVSHYHYRVETNQTSLSSKMIPFKNWVQLAYGEQDPLYYDKPKMFMPQSQWVCDDAGNLLVNFVGKFENLEADFSTICQKIGKTGQLPHLKQSRHGHYRDLYDDKTALVVATWFKQDIDRFGYTY